MCRNVQVSRKLGSQGANIWGQSAVLTYSILGSRYFCRWQTNTPLILPMIQDDLKKNNIQATSKLRRYMVLRHMNFCLVIYICAKNSVCGSFATFFSCYVSVEYVMFLKTFPWKHTYDFLDSADACRTRNFSCKRLALVSLYKLTSKLLVKYPVGLARFLKRQCNILWYRWFLGFRCVYALMWKSCCCFLRSKCFGSTIVTSKKFFAWLVLNAESDESRLPCISGVFVFYGVEWGY